MISKNIVVIYKNIVLISGNIVMILLLTLCDKPNDRYSESSDRKTIALLVI